VRLLIFCILLGFSPAIAFAQEKVVQTFDGSGAFETPVFHVHDGWKMEWDFQDPYSIDVTALDRSTVMSVSDAPKGVITLAKGGSFTLRINRSLTRTKLAWHIVIRDTQPDQAPALANNGPSASASAAANPGPTLAPTSTSMTNDGTPTSGLTADQAHAVVVIKGDVAEGTGFLVKTADGPAVVTNLHVISANPNIKILTATGAQVKVLSLKGASDRDLAMIAIQDDHYTYLDLATDIQNTVQTGDEVITPGNSEGGEVVLNTKGQVQGIGPDQIEFNNPIYHGKSGKVVAVVTRAMKVTNSDDLDKASFANSNSAIVGSMRYFGLRLDTVTQWQPYDWNRFLAETTFLKNFHEVSRSLDSYINGAAYEKAHVTSPDENGPPNSKYYLRNEKIETAHDNYHKTAADADNSQQLDARRELVMDLQGIADGDMTTIQNPANFYSFNQTLAVREIKYRKELRSEIDTVGSKISDMGH
jgi:hypothetical protein